MPISLILTPIDHFQFRPTSGLLSSQDLTYCLIWMLTPVGCILPGGVCRAVEVEATQLVQRGVDPVFRAEAGDFPCLLGRFLHHVLMRGLGPRGEEEG